VAPSGKTFVHGSFDFAGEQLGRYRRSGQRSFETQIERF
jgi:hypothetical protein